MAAAGDLRHPGSGANGSGIPWGWRVCRDGDARQRAGRSTAMLKRLDAHYRYRVFDPILQR